MIVARQFIAWNRLNRESVPGRARSDPYSRLISRPERGTPIAPNHTVPYGTVPVFARIPGNKLPGYDHLVPSGQSPEVLTGTSSRLPYPDDFPNLIGFSPLTPISSLVFPNPSTTPSEIAPYRRPLLCLSLVSRYPESDQFERRTGQCCLRFRQDGAKND